MRELMQVDLQTAIIIGTQVGITTAFGLMMKSQKDGLRDIVEANKEIVKTLYCHIADREAHSGNPK